MESTWFRTPLIGASGIKYCPEQIALVKARTLSITARMTFNASATGNGTVHVLYSPEGRHTDTIDLQTITVTVSAGNTVQVTEVVDVPEHGYLEATVENGDQTYSITDVMLWYSVQSWELPGAPRRGALREDVSESDVGYPGGD